MPKLFMQAKSLRKGRRRSEALFRGKNWAAGAEDGEGREKGQQTAEEDAMFRSG
jgi:hypothetical protein